MATSEAQLRASEKYIKEKTDELRVRLPKGKKQVFQAHIKTTGESLNAFIQRAMQETMERDEKSI